MSGAPASPPPLPPPPPPPSPSRWARWQAVWRLQWRSHLLTVLIAVAAFAAVQAWQTRDAPRGPAPDFSLPLLLPGGRTAAAPQSLSAWRQAHPGRAVAVYVWAEWCPFCKAQEPAVTAVAQDWPVLSVATRSGTAAQVAAHMRRRGLSWTTVLDPAGQVQKQYGLGMVPLWIVIAPDGELSSIAPGYTTEWGMRLRLWLAQNF